LLKAAAAVQVHVKRKANALTISNISMCKILTAYLA